MNIRHLLFPKTCMRYLRIDGDANIVCKECGRQFGFTYDMHPIKAFVFYKYLRYKPEISHWIKHEAKEPPTVDEWAEMHFQALQRMKEHMKEELEETNIIVEDSEFREIDIDDDDDDMAEILSEYSYISAGNEDENDE